MKVIGITGGVGSGKSYVLDLMKREFGAAVIQADLVAHDLMEPGAASYEGIVEHFGKEILAVDGRIDRKRLGDVVFGSEEELLVLNGITHPNVKEEIISRIAAIRMAGEASCIALEAALLLEEQYDQICDAIWYVYADYEVRIGRLMEARGYELNRCEAIMKQQKSEDYFRRRCDETIDNSGGLEGTLEQLRRMKSFACF